MGARFLWSQRGSAAAFIALGLCLLAVAIGVAVDMTRVQMAQTKMQEALDTTGKELADSAQVTNAPKETRDHFFAHFPANYMGTTIINITAIPNSNYSVINTSASGAVNTVFLNLFGINTVSISALHQVNRHPNG